MANFYVSSVDGNDGTPANVSWWNGNQDTYASITGALAAATGVGPHVLYVSHVHAHTASAAITWNAATATARISILSVNRATGARATGATESVGASNSTFNVGTSTTVSQKLYLYGLTLNGATNNNAASDLILANVGNSANHVTIHCQSCTLAINSINQGAQLQLGTTIAGSSATLSTSVRLDDCILQTKNNATNPGIILGSSYIEIFGMTHAFLGANKSAALFGFLAGSIASIADSDLSGYDSGAYFDVSAFYFGRIDLVNCKIHATPGVTTGTWPTSHSAITRVNADSGDTHNVFAHYNRLGTITVDTGVFADSGHQFDGAGISWKIVTTAECNEHEPFVTPWLHRWLDAAGVSTTFKLQLIRDSATDFTNREVWAAFETLQSGSFPNGTLTSTRNAQPFDGTGVDLTNSSEVWTESLTNDNEMEVAATLTPAEKSMVRARLSVGVASTTLYLDPGIWVS